MKKRFIALMMAGGLALSMLAGCGDDPGSTSGERRKEEKTEKDKDKDKEKEKEKEAEKEKNEEEDQDWQSKYAGDWAEEDGDLVLAVNFNDDCWNVYDMSADGEILLYGNYECDKDSLYLYDYDGNKVSTMYVNNDGRLVDSDDGSVFEYDPDGTLSRAGEVDERYVDGEGYSDEEMSKTAPFEGAWQLENDYVVLYIYDDYKWAFYDDQDEFMGQSGSYKIKGNVISIEFDDEYYDLTLTDPDTLMDPSQEGEVYHRL